MMNEDLIARVMRETGMDRMQAVYHLRGREALTAAAASVRAPGTVTRIPSATAVLGELRKTPTEGCTQ